VGSTRRPKQYEQYSSQDERIEAAKNGDPSAFQFALHMDRETLLLERPGASGNRVFAWDPASCTWTQHPTIRNLGVRNAELFARNALDFTEPSVRSILNITGQNINERIEEMREKLKAVMLQD
jgi:hypothetical protein